MATNSTSTGAATGIEAIADEVAVMACIGTTNAVLALWLLRMTLGRACLAHDDTLRQIRSKAVVALSLIVALGCGIAAAGVWLWARPCAVCPLQAVPLAAVLDGLASSIVWVLSTAVACGFAIGRHDACIALSTIACGIAWAAGRVAVTRFLHGAPLTAAVVDACAAAVEGAAVILATQLVAVPRYHELLRAVVMARGDPDSPLGRMRPSAVASRVFSIRALQCTAVYVTAVRLLAAMARAAGLVAWIGPQILAAGGFAAISWTVARAALFTEHPDLADDSDASWVEGGQHDASGAEDLASGAAWLFPGTDTPAVGTFALTDVLRPAAAKVVRSRSTPPQLRVASVLH